MSYPMSSCLVVDKAPPLRIHGVAHLDGWESTLVHQSVDLAAARAS
jgi:hypothetical protein